MLTNQHRNSITLTSNPIIGISWPPWCQITKYRKTSPRSSTDSESQMGQMRSGDCSRTKVSTWGAKMQANHDSLLLCLCFLRITGVLKPGDKLCERDSIGTCNSAQTLWFRWHRGSNSWYIMCCESKTWLMIWSICLELFYQSLALLMIIFLDLAGGRISKKALETMPSHGSSIDF